MTHDIRVLIVDDHFVVRKGTHALLAGAENIEVVGEAGDGQEAVEQAELLEPGVILMDLVMPRMDGVEAIRRILARQPDVRILILTGFNIDDKIVAAVRAGALGYLSKSSTREELLRAVQHVHRGDPWLPAGVTRKLLFELGPPGRVASPLDELTKREVEILRLVSKGWSNRRVADSVGIAEVTVRTHVSHVLHKLGLQNRVEAALYALRNGVASLDDL